MPRKTKIEKAIAMLEEASRYGISISAHNASALEVAEMLKTAKKDKERLNWVLRGMKLINWVMDGDPPSRKAIDRAMAEEREDVAKEKKKPRGPRTVASRGKLQIREDR